MGKHRNRRRFYPEFYTDEELRQMQQQEERDKQEKQKKREAFQMHEQTAEVSASEELAEKRAEYAEKIQEYYMRNPPDISDALTEIPEESEQIDIECDNSAAPQIPAGVADTPFQKEAAEEIAGEWFAAPGHFEVIEDAEEFEEEAPVVFGRSTLFSEPSEFDGFDYINYFENEQPETETTEVTEAVDMADAGDDDAARDMPNSAPLLEETTDINEIQIEIPPHMHIQELPDLQATPVFAPVTVTEPEMLPEFIIEPAEPEAESEPATETIIEPAEETLEAEPEIEPEPLPLSTPLESPLQAKQMHETPGMISFDRERAVEYARRWALDRNPEYYNFEDIGGDCTNYISQILLAGGCKMDKTPIYGWYYNNANDKSPSWTGVEQLYSYLMREKDRGIIAAEIDLHEVEAGDIAQLSFNGKNFQHTPFIISVKRSQSGEVAYGGIKICAHSYDSDDRALDSYQWRKIRFIRILGWKE